MSVIAHPAPSPIRAATASPERRLYIGDATWADYEMIGEVFRDRCEYRINYDRGRLEIMTVSAEHDRIKHIMGRFVEVLVEEHGLEMAPFGSMTFKREDLEKGFEPDQCFWIRNEPRMRGHNDWNPTVDPPPDLIIEVEVTRSVVPRMPTFAAFGVPEVWRCDLESVTVELLQPDGTFAAVPRSPMFPKVDPSGIVPFLAVRPNETYLALIRSFRTWVRGQFAA